ncbi:MAG: alpha-amylase [Aerococcus sp.]|nr:alpha-amylase [Aerococcus sp.]
MTNENGVMMQYFEWYLSSDGKHLQRVKEDAKHLKDIGVTHVWLPPQTKATGADDVGYGIYDLFDLGEFDQKGTVRTKYGTKKEYLAAIKALHDAEILVYADVVLNHKAGADEKETFNAYPVNPNNREELEKTEPIEIEAWTKFTFPGRGDTYSDFKWDWTCFSGVDYDERTGQKGIYMIDGFEKGWADSSHVDDENGNYDYLMFADIDYKNDNVVNHVNDWAEWFISETGVDGFRMDAVKHIDSDFMKQFIEKIKAAHDGFFAVGEYWKGDYESLNAYMEKTDYALDLFDVPLALQFKAAGDQGANYDMSHLLDSSVLVKNPTIAVTFVNNHDSEPGQALENWVAGWFKPLAYAIILLEERGFPCVFYGDYYGIQGDHPEDGQSEILDQLLKLRQERAYGEQTLYYDDPHCVGFTRHGDSDHPNSGLAVIMSNEHGQEKTMQVGNEHAGEVWVDQLQHVEGELTISEDGEATFACADGSVSVWAKKDVNEE